MFAVAACGRSEATRTTGSAPKTGQAAPTSLAMGGVKSVTRFFVTSRGSGHGGDLGGLTGADAHCQALAQAEGSGDHTWRAYLSVQADDGQPAVNARDRIGSGPWYNALGDRVAVDVQDLHRAPDVLNEENALTERGDMLEGTATDVLTGSRPDGTAFPAGDDRTCRNWRSDRNGHAEVGRLSGQKGQGTARAWNAAGVSPACSERALRSGGGGRFYCFAID
ncbi:MAG TPA: hypothetical protein VL173_01310 [Vicinamibacterales bacterium]|nr:hypothetical protein [Vicinamibacterales bacterium]